MVGAGTKGKLLEEGRHTGEKTLRELDQEFQKRKDKLSLVEDIKVENQLWITTKMVSLEILR